MWLVQTSYDAQKTNERISSSIHSELFPDQGVGGYGANPRNMACKLGIPPDWDASISQGIIHYYK